MSDTNRVKTTLAKEDVHLAWADSFRTPENEPFFELAFQHIAHTMKAANDATILDAGCGSGRHSIRLAKQGFKVTGIDFSDFILKEAERTVTDLGLRTRVNFRQEDLLNLSFKDEAFDHVLCWGVLMHIPAIETAIAELSRVLKKGGLITISEVNASSTEVLAQQILRPFLGSGTVETKRTPAGLEAWAKTPSGDLMSRRTNIRWLIHQFNAHGIDLVTRRSGQFTQAYTRLKSKHARRLVHRLNDFWFKYIDLPALACGNIITMQKRRARHPCP